MSQTYFTILTHLGARKLAEATASGTQLKLTHLAVGDGNGTVPVPLPTQTQLIHEVRRSTINTIYTDEKNENYIIVEQVIPPEDGGFYIRELGVFDDKGNLIAVGNCPPSYKPKLSEGSGRTQVINMVIMIDNTGTVELKIDASTVLATRKYVDDLISSKMTEHEKSANHPDASTASKGFVQLNSAIDSDAENQAATPKAVNAVYELANKKLPLTGGVVTGNTNFTSKLQQAGNDVITTENLKHHTGCGKIIAWGRFDYFTNSSINIIASSGIRAIARTATGRYTVTLSTSIDDMKYVVNCNSQQNKIENECFANTCVPMHLRENHFEIWCGDNQQDKFFDTSNCYFIVVVNNN